MPNTRTPRVEWPFTTNEGINPAAVARQIEEEFFRNTGIQSASRIISRREQLYFAPPVIVPAANLTPEQLEELANQPVVIRHTPLPSDADLSNPTFAETAASTNWSVTTTGRTSSFHQDYPISWDVVEGTTASTSNASCSTADLSQIEARIFAAGNSTASGTGRAWSDSSISTLSTISVEYLRYMREDARRFEELTRHYQQLYSPAITDLMRGSTPIATTTHSPKGNTMARNPYESLVSIRENVAPLTHTPLFIDHQMLGHVIWGEGPNQDEVDLSICPPSVIYNVQPECLTSRVVSYMGYNWFFENDITLIYGEINARRIRHRIWYDMRVKARRRLQERITRWTREATTNDGIPFRKCVSRYNCDWNLLHMYHVEFLRNPSVTTATRLRDSRIQCNLSYQGMGGKIERMYHFSVLGREEVNQQHERRPLFSKLYDLFTTFNDRDKVYTFYLNRCVHQSEMQPDRIAYLRQWSNFVRFDESGDIRDPLYTITSVGKFLTLFSNETGLTLSPEWVKDTVNEWMAKAKGPEMKWIDNDDPVWADSPEALGKAWYDAYKTINVDYSCMRGIPATKCYGLPGNHLRLVWWEDCTGKKLSRAICRTDTTTHQYVRAYPSATFDGGASEELCRKRLEAAGYVPGSLMGIMLRRLPGDNMACPYVDSGTMYDPGVDPDHWKGHSVWVIGEADNTEYGAQNTSNYGYVCSCDEDDEDDYFTCDCCGNDRDNDERTYSNYADENYCQRCIDNGSVVEALVGRNRYDWVEESNCREIGDSGNYIVDHPRVIEECGYVECPHCGELISESLTETDEGEMACDDCIISDYRTVDGHDLPVLLINTIETHDGRRIHIDDSETRNGLVCHVDDEESGDEQIAIAA